MQRKEELSTYDRELHTASVKDFTLAKDLILAMKDALAQAVRENERSDHAPGTAPDFGETEADVAWR